MRVRTGGIILCLVMLITIASPLISPVSADGENLTVCCDSSEFDYLFIGSGGNPTLTPFDSDLGEEESVVVETSIAQATAIQTWSHTPGWGGQYDSSTWDFTIPYIVENAAGVQVNATVIVKIGSLTYEGYSPPGTTYLPAGEGNQLLIPIEIDAGSLSATDEIKITLEIQTLVFSIPGTDAKIEFKWGTEDYRGSIHVDLPLVGMAMAPPIVDGRSVHIAVIFKSGYDTRIIGSSVVTFTMGGNVLSSNPVLEMDGPDVKATWTWQASDSLSDGWYSANISLDIQSGNQDDYLQGEASWEIDFGIGGGGSGGSYYPPEEPLQTDGSGSDLRIHVNAGLSKDGIDLLLSRTTILHIEGTQALWLRWGMNNMGNTTLPSTSTWAMFLAGGVSQEMRDNIVVDPEESRELGSQLQSGRLMTFIDSGLFLESDELLGGRFSDFLTVEVVVDTLGDSKISNAPVSIRISTTQILVDADRHTMVRTFLKSQPLTYWKDVTVSIEFQTSPGTSLARVEIESDDVVIDSSHMRLFTTEKLSISSGGFSQGDVFSISLQPTSNQLYSPLVMFSGIFVILLAGVIISLKIGRQKNKVALYLEFPLAAFSLLAYIFAYSLETVGIIAIVTAAIWIVTAFVSPRNLESLRRGNSLPERPTISCPKCATVNPVVSEIRPLKLPCGGCGVVLKIVD
ncbi:MAG: hypothetical protein HOE92_05300 [Euryarchaeota archaeon]|jgi:hypothetical protein|nr:hypothetical protein [Euryarchaeota archaeon]MBT3971614.1 hypothetical protein [Euryarchaeota archaeon]